MKIGIILHSQTGNTLQVGEKLLEKLRNDGHNVTLLRMQNRQNTDATKRQKEVNLDCMPEVAGYDALIFGGWVEAFQLCSGLTMYLNQLAKIETNNVSCFVTQHFPFRWMGGNNALAKMASILAIKGVKVRASGVVNWSNKQKEKQIDALVELFSRQFDN